jgi:hypothetical protein
VCTVAAAFWLAVDDWLAGELEAAAAVMPPMVATAARPMLAMMIRG